MKLESLSKFGLNSKSLTTLVGGMDKTGGSASSPSTTFVDGQPECSDSRVIYDNDKGTVTGRCTTYTCPD
jgi:hypothetical protein